MAVATNKRLAPTQKLMDHFGWNKYFEFIECSDSHESFHTKKDMVSYIITKSSEYQRGYFLGDTVSDGLAANINNVSFLQASYGYGKNQDWSNVKIQKKIKRFIDLKKVIF